jgi:hypothetical protein
MAASRSVCVTDLDALKVLVDDVELSVFTCVHCVDVEKLRKPAQNTASSEVRKAARSHVAELVEVKASYAEAGYDVGAKLSIKGEGRAKGLDSCLKEAYGEPFVSGKDESGAFSSVTADGKTATLKLVTASAAGEASASKRRGSRRDAPANLHRRCDSLPAT